jgi:multidrug efflux pump subunit AcrB
MIVGIIGENAIFTFLQFKESLGEQNVDDAVTFAISTRLRPKLMTALGAIIALLPLGIGHRSGRTTAPAIGHCSNRWICDWFTFATYCATKFDQEVLQQKE